MSKHMEDNSEKYGVLVMALAMLAAIIALPMSAYAGCSHEDWGKAKHSEFFDKRMKALHDELRLSDSQETAWNEFIENSKPSAQPSRLDRLELSKLPTPERLDRMLSMMKERQLKMESHARAVKTFYGHLTAEQQKIFDGSFRPYKGNHEQR